MKSTWKTRVEFAFWLVIFVAVIIGAPSLREMLVDGASTGEIVWAAIMFAVAIYAITQLRNAWGELR